MKFRVRRQVPQGQDLTDHAAGGPVAPTRSGRGHLGAVAQRVRGVGGNGRRGRRLVAGLVAAAALPIVAVAVAQPASASIGFYNVSSSPTGSNVQLDINAELALVPDYDTVKVNWGDGTSDTTAGVLCKEPDGTITTADSACMWGLKNTWYQVQDGLYYVSSGHPYYRPGTYTATLSYKSVGITYSTSWRITSPGVKVPLYVPSDSNLGVTVSPAPLEDDGIQTYWGQTFHQYMYYPGDQVTVKVTNPDVIPATWKTWGCSERCIGGAFEPYDESDLVGTNTPTLNVTVPRPDFGVGGRSYLPASGVERALMVTTTPNLVTNGGFEQPALSSNSWKIFGSTGVPGWLGSPNVEIDNYSDASDGNQYTELASDQPTQLTTAIPVTDGGVYRLTFDYSGRPGTSDADNRMQLITQFENTNYDYTTLSSNDVGNSSRVWHTYTGTFTAFGLSQATLSFADAGDVKDGYGMSIDNVQVVRIS